MSMNDLNWVLSTLGKLKYNPEIWESGDMIIDTYNHRREIYEWTQLIKPE